VSPSGYSRDLLGANAVGDPVARAALRCQLPGCDYARRVEGPASELADALREHLVRDHSPRVVAEHLVSAWIRPPNREAPPPTEAVAGVHFTAIEDQPRPEIRAAAAAAPPVLVLAKKPPRRRRGRPPNGVESWTARAVRLLRACGGRATSYDLFQAALRECPSIGRGTFSSALTHARKRGLMVQTRRGTWRLA
jgi:hypothetical protein